MSKNKRKDLTILSLIFVFCWLLTTGAGRALAKLPPAVSANALRPPLVKAWEYQSSNALGCALPLGNGKIAFSTVDSYGVLDMRTGELIWEKSVNTAIGSTSTAVIGGVSLAYDGYHLFALLQAGKIDACDPADGHTLWQIPTEGYASPAVVQRGKLITSLHGGEMSAVEIATHRVLWTIKIFPESVHASSRGYVQRIKVAVEATGATAVFCQGNWITAVSTASGKVLWRRNCPTSMVEAGSTALSALDVDRMRAYTFGTNGDIEALSLESGTTVWRRHEPDYVGYFQSVAIGSGLLVSVTSSGSVRGYSTDCGALQWTSQLSAAETAYVTPPMVYDDNRVLIVNNQSAIALSGTTGRRLWSWELDHDPLTSTACYDAEGQLIVASQKGLLCFRHGTPPRLPSAHAARVKLARSLAAKLADIPSRRTPYAPDVRADERELLRLGDDAFDALFPYLESSAFTMADTPLVLEGDSIFGHIYALISQVMRPDSKSQTAAILRLDQKFAHLATYYGAYSPLACLLADHGHSDLVIPALTAAVNAVGRGRNYWDMPPELDCLCNSHSPLAVEFLVSKLNNPDTPPELRAAIYCGIAKSGSDTAVAALVAIRNQPLTPLPSFRTLMDLDHLPNIIPTPKDIWKSRLLGIGTDDSGTSWGLLTSGVIGSGGDLWIVPRVGDRWGDPIFTGVDTTEETEFFRGDNRKPFLLDGMTLVQLVDSGKWIEKFVHNQDLLKDSDGDGWTDLVEQRLGTDPMRASTDESGVKDSLNREPLGSRSPKGDFEEVLAVAFDARMRFRNEDLLAPLVVTFPKGTSPFRLTGSNALIVGKSESGDAKTNLEMRYGEGVGLVGFGEPRDSPIGFDPRYRRRTQRKDDPVRWNASHTEATVGISVYFGGTYGDSYDIRVRKVRGRWMAVGAKETMVS